MFPINLSISFRPLQDEVITWNNGPQVQIVADACYTMDKPATITYPFLNYEAAVQPTEHERSPFALLKCDDLHYAFAQHLTLIEIVSAAMASYHFNQYAEAYVFPRWTVLDLSDPRDFRFAGKRANNSLYLCELRRMLNRVGPYVETVVLNGQWMRSYPHWMFLHSVLLAGTRMRRLHLEDFELSADRALPATLNERDWCGQLEHLELKRSKNIEQILAACNKLQTMDIKFCQITGEQLMAAVRRNAATLRRLSMVHIQLGFGGERGFTDFLQDFPNIVPLVSDVSLCLNHLQFLNAAGQYDHLEVDRPVCDMLVEEIMRFPRLRRLSANYKTNLRQADLKELRLGVIELAKMGTLKELHLIVDDVDLVGKIAKCLAELVPTVAGQYHMHVFVYGHHDGTGRRWLKDEFSAKCQWGVLRDSPYKSAAICPGRHLVDRLRPSCDCVVPLFRQELAEKFACPE